MPEYEDKDLRELIVFPYRLVYRVRSDRLDVTPFSTVHNSYPKRCNLHPDP